MRVLTLGAYPPPHGGVQTNLVAIRRYLHERGVSCEVINLTRYRGTAADGVYYPRSSLQVLWLLLRLRYDVIHLHIGGQITSRLLLLCLVCTLIPWARTVLTLHSGGYPSSEEGKTVRPRTLRGFVFRRLDSVIAVNAEILRLFRNFGLPENRVRLISPYASTAPRHDVVLPESIRLFFASHSPVLLTVSGLEPEYDLPIQIAVLGLLRERFSGIGLVILGSGSLETEIRGKIAGASYSSHVLLAGDVPHDVVLRAIEECDLVLRTTLFDGDSIAVREALSLGAPVIASDNGMRPPGVDLVPPADLAALRSAIEKRLASTVRPPRETGGFDDRNLAAVFEVYRELV